VSLRTRCAGHRSRQGPDFDSENVGGQKYDDPMVFYRNWKLANVWFTYATARRLEGFQASEAWVSRGLGAARARAAA
jgi:hypothetical protein